jgi:peptide/nickel transport system substrate-binding protein
VDRRRFLHILGLSPAAVALLAACGSDGEPDDPGSASGGTGVRTGPSVGELRVAEPFLPTSLDSDSGTAGSALMAFGVAEALMRYTHDLRPEPWLAAKLERIDPLTWRATLRDDATFWDGSKVDAAAVVASFQRSLQMLPSAASLIPKESVLTPEGQVLTIKTPAPMGLLDHNLTSGSLTIKKVGPGESLTYTGPFRVTEFTARETMTLEAYPGYRGGPARLRTVGTRQVADASARLLALQAGDVDVAHALLPGDVARLKSSGHQVFASPWARQHMLIINTRAAPLDDANVRRAYSLAIDRELLKTGVMEGIGAGAYGFSPEDIGHKNVVRTQKFDPAEAQRLLETAGWRMGAGGFREKNGQRLTFKIGTYSGRAELEQFAVVIKDMVKAVGIDLEIEKFADVETALAQNAFQSTTYSIGSAAFGDLSQLISTLYVPSPRNKDRYDNPRVTALFDEYVATSEAARQADLLKQMQEMIGQDVPVVYLYNPYQIVGATAKLKDYTPHALERDKYTPDMHLA